MPVFTPTALPCRILSHLSLSSCLVPAFCVLPALFSCKDTVTDPEKQKDWRSITWEIDTITYPGSYQTAMRSIYATGPENVYIVGWNDRAFGKMFHFSGESWTDVKLNVSQGGTLTEPVDELSAITGFGPNQIWAVGMRLHNNPDPQGPYFDSSVVIFFDGIQWKEQGIVPRRGRRLQCIWGSGPSDIWAAGMNTLIHYNGLTWQHFPVELPPQGIQFLSLAGFSSQDVYLLGSRRNVDNQIDTVAYLLYHYDGRSWSLEDSSVQINGTPAHKFGHALGTAQNELFSVGWGVYRRYSGIWIELLRLVWPLNAVFAFNPSAIFVTGTNNQLYHFNGTDWYQFSEFSSIGSILTGIWADKNNVMIVGTDGYRSFVLRGK